MGKYYSSSQTIQEDKSIAISGDAEVLTGADAITALPTSVVIADSPGVTVGNITFEQFPEAVENSVAALVGVVETSVLAGSDLSRETARLQIESQELIARSTLQSNQALAQKLKETEQGAASMLPEIAKYVAIAAVVIVVASRVG